MLLVHGDDAQKKNPEEELDEAVDDDDVKRKYLGRILFREKQKVITRYETCHGGTKTKLRSHHT